MTRIGRVTVAFRARCRNCTTFWKLNVSRPAAARVKWNAKCLEPRFCFLIFLDLDIQKLAHDRTTPYTVSCLASLNPYGVTGNFKAVRVAHAGSSAFYSKPA